MARFTHQELIRGCPQKRVNARLRDCAGYTKDLQYSVEQLRNGRIIDCLIVRCCECGAIIVLYRDCDSRTGEWTTLNPNFSGLAEFGRLEFERCGPLVINKQNNPW